MTVDRDASFAYFVYPFLFDSGDLGRRQRTLIAQQIETGKSQQPMWVPKTFGSSDLLPHVIRYLETKPPEKTPLWQKYWRHKPETTPVLKLSNAALTSYAGLGNRGLWTLLTPVPACPDIVFQLQSVELALFPVGIGFVIVSVSPTEAACDMWLNFLHYFRIADGQRGVNLQVRRRTGKDQWAPYFPELAGGISSHPDGVGRFADILMALLRTGASSWEDKRGEDWWQEVFITGRLIPFVSLYVDGMPDKDVEKGRLLYRIRNFFHAAQDIYPKPQELNLLRNPALLPYTEDQWFVFSREGGAFVACDAPPHSDSPSGFFRKVLPQHLQQQYFLLFLLALQQRFALLELSHMISEHWLPGDDTQRRQELERIRNAMLKFSARGYFLEVTQREHHHRYYLKWRKALLLEQLYTRLQNDLREMHDYVQIQHQHAQEERGKRQTRRIKRMELSIAILGVLFTFSQALLALFAWINFAAEGTYQHKLATWADAVSHFISDENLFHRLTVWLESVDWLRQVPGAPGPAWWQHPITMVIAGLVAVRCAIRLVNYWLQKRRYR